jgi:hypothetical protein
MECGCEGAHLIVQRRVVSPQGIIKNCFSARYN